ncbi:CaiB/BaiF CoA transferase family protein [Yinghuangia seranimata]|uniref:CaiB/BaiF CoA transferase family protein n=1 Tax=Yinghuangia seranimata TaxID=408067 RepID=UPI00248AA3C2|nr:CoA transferase [Yinghuangia seranimata]MDI2126087.1 CoA transferase [Yinghuangia seranimata]
MAARARRRTADRSGTRGHDGVRRRRDQGLTVVPADAQAGPLAGLRVLDLSTLLAAPQIAALLGDFGAAVVKWEPPGGDPLRAIGAQRDGHSLLWPYINRNKRSLVLDLETPGGIRDLRRITEQVDVVVENHPQTVLRRWGADWPSMHARNPGLVMVSVSCYGADGPYRDRFGNGSLAEGFAGLTHLTGEADGPPTLPSVPLGDSLTALSGVIGVLLACRNREVLGGQGQHVDVSMYEPVLALLGPTVAGWDRDGGAPPPARTGSRVPGGVPRNVYRTRDGHWIVVSGTTDRQVARVLQVIGQETPDNRARYGTSSARLAAADELDAIVADWIADRDRADAVAALVDARIPVAPVNDLAGLAADPHIAARGNLHTVDAGPAGPVLMPAPAPRLAATPGRIRAPGPALGVHDGELRAEFGLTPARPQDA